MRLIRFFMFVITLSLAAIATVAAGDDGLEIGTSAPAFSLVSQDEQIISLENLLKDGPVAIVFYRSAAW